MTLGLLVPAPFDTVSGGYAYDRRIVAGLRGGGHAVDVIELGGRHPRADDHAIAEAGRALALVGGRHAIIDGLCLPAFAAHRDALAAIDPIGLIHHPTSLETGLSDDDRAWLLEAEKALLPGLRRLIVTSQATKLTLVQQFGVSESRAVVIEPGTDPAPRAQGSGGPGCSILAIGTLVPRKGHDVLLKAVARLHDLSWRLTIVGAPARDASHTRDLQDLAATLGIADRVTFAGEATGSALDRLWDGADLFALATRYEGYGMVIAEALARGLPVAVTSGGAAADLVPPGGGVVSAVDDDASLSRAMRRLIHNPALRQAYAEAAWQGGRLLPDWAAQTARFAEACR